jgi:hypothetical protein
MKNLFVSFLCLFSVTTFTNAQNANDSKGDMEAQRAKQLEQVVSASKTAGLSDVEIEKVKTIIAVFRQKQADINNDTTIVVEEKKTKLKEANAEKDWKIQNLMGKDRYKLYADARKKIAVEEASQAPKN